MKTPFMLRRAFQAMIPAVFLLASCGKDDDPVTPVVEQGRIIVSHAAAAANTAVTVAVNDVAGGQLTYGQTGTYFNIAAGTPKLSIRNGTTDITSQVVTIAKGQNYSAFAYSPTATIGSAALLVVPDDLTAPSTGTAKVRVVHLGVGAPSPVRLTLPSAVPGAAGTDITADVAFGAASAFAPINAGSYSLGITAAVAGSTIRTQAVAVGDGSGTGTGTKTFEGGKIYTVIVRGIAGTAVPAAQQIQAVIIQNN
jgi:hypothetical protein